MFDQFATVLDRALRLRVEFEPRDLGRSPSGPGAVPTGGTDLVRFDAGHPVPPTSPELSA